ncbi:copper resistance system multicopper oxidase [Pseudomonas nicosulfuronedens]|uniref:Copper resistance system multicopper oxidase n=1 Tax=Pseudomonas nicosulfuronedens TaxID=2571105 RepID=A0A5R9R9V3_9PSED|nr:copper resistance system multicopper oxidase [Pseudomonas nicosulfuronedens]MDH1010253.1 copper resistance system multicopper oxidase [Pseudomonas nicosulfuronedens]MDH1980266.1 copper resistance system multicopper oxidase [Pseudomonas nicosulfuronedens]MDH2025488.1 copper resistance system multicopper oxidase [Pseudomonas nicosulfuronedens]TLX78892.1 copper resistance system multicopper oxidase [Pseudomonas nicosulfuronedens]
MIRAREWALGALLLAPLAVQAGVYDLTIGEGELKLSDGARKALTVNGRTPAPELRFKEDEDVELRVTNTLDRDTSLHWHGLILPYTQDGVPGISFPGIKPGETFTYRFTVKQSGTYWYHAHSDFQEIEGLYGPLVIEPKAREPYRYDREYTLLLADWHDTRPETVFANLKKQSDYYNRNQRTLGDFIADSSANGFMATLRDRLDWGGMRMTPTDIADIAGFRFLVNGQDSEQNWTGLFKPGERVRLRIINGSGMSYFDLRIPGLKMTVVQADGNDVQPVTVDELRIAVAETYDVIVQPQEDRAYTFFAEAMDRSGYARATLTPRKGMVAEVPALRERPLLTMADMGMSHEGMDHSGMAMDGQGDDVKASGMAGMDHSTMQGMDHSQMAGMDHSDMGAAAPKSDYAPGSGLTPQPAAPGNRLLVYADLKAMRPYADYRAPDRIIEFRLTGNMERYFWSIDGKKYSEAEPIRLTYGERVRIRFVNDTMMTHPMHLHGMWMQLDKGNGRFNPLKHVVSVAPGSTLDVDVPADALGEWAFHCHLIYHMAAGMMRKVIVEPAPASASL